MKADLPEIEDDKVKRIWGMMNNPFSLIFQGGSAGLLAARKVILMLILFFVANLFLIVYANWVFFTGSADIGHFPWVLAVVATAVVCTLIAAYLGYKFVLIEALSVCYRSMDGVFRQLCSGIIDKASEHKTLLDRTKLGELSGQRLAKFPWLLRRAVQMVMKKVPLVYMLGELKTDIQAGRKEEAAQKLFIRLDTFIEEHFFAQNSNRWMSIIFFINLLVSLILIVYKIG